MKKLKITLVILSLVTLNAKFHAQSTSANNIGLAGKFLGYSNNFVLPFQTNGFNRMLIDNGAGGQGAGRVALGNNLTGFTPVDRLHLHQVQTNLQNINTFMRFTNTFTGPTNTDGFTIGNNGGPIGPNVGTVFMQQFEQNPVIIRAPNAHSFVTLPYEWFRLQNGQAFQAGPLSIPHSTDGYIGLNKPNPRSHIEMVTPAINGGEEFFLAKPDDILDPTNPTQLAPNVQMGMMNLSGQNNRFLPGVFGNINQTQQDGPALQMLGAISTNQDLPFREPIMRFMVGRDWIINANNPANVGGAPAQAIVNRPIFSWQNADMIHMYMMANGRARLGYNINVGIPPPIPDFMANNRLEITSFTIDPYYNAAGSPVPNPNWNNTTIGGSSGLRFTFLRSFDFVQVPTLANGIDPTKVLTTDRNGDVVMIQTLGVANNGLSAVNGTVQLGIPCPAPSASAITASQLLSNRQIPMNTFNFVFSGQTPGSNRVGIGTGCLPGNKLEIDNGIANPNTSGLRLTRLTSSSATQVNPGLGVLAVNPNGDVIYVPGGSSTANNGLSVVNGTVQLGATCGSPTAGLAALTNSVEVPLANNSLIFSETAAGNGRVGIGKGIGCAPGNQLEINAGTGPNSLSGLRLTDLANNPPALANPFNKVLAVNNSGDVILTNLPPTGGLGNSCGLLSNPLPIDWEIPLNNFNFRFQSAVTGTAINNVGIGTTCAPIAKLHVEQSSLSTTGSMGIFVENKDQNNCGGGPVIGLKSLVSNTNLNDLKCAGWFESVNAPNCFGSVLNYAIIVPQNGGMVEIGYNPVNGSNLGSYLLDVNGVTNSAQGYQQNSDQTLKNSITPIPNALNKIKNLNPVTYKWNTPSSPSMAGTHSGFIAQEVDTVIPHIVHTGNNGLKSIAYDEIIPYIVSAMQTQQKQIKTQDSLIQVLTQNIASCCANNSARNGNNNSNQLNQLNIDLSDKDFIVLNQNQPNPFAEQTTITYNVPEKYGFAQLVFKTLDGKIIKTVDITKKGRGVVNVFANDLSNGLYMYSLIVDGDVIDTKKMVKQN